MGETAPLIAGCSAASEATAGYWAVPPDVGVVTDDDVPGWVTTLGDVADEAGFMVWVDAAAAGVFAGAD